MRSLVIVAALLLPVSSRASVVSCLNQPDGTQCQLPCVLDGVCKNDKCINGTKVENGTPCATGDQCTVNDSCHNGTCIAGQPRLCPEMPCASAVCDSSRGCVYLNYCDLGSREDLLPLPDLTPVPVTSPDLGGAREVFTSPDLRLVTVDGSSGHPDGGSGHPDSTGADGGAGSKDPDTLFSTHVRGGGCGIVDRGSSTAWWLFCALGAALGVRRRRREEYHEIP